MERFIKQVTMTGADDRVYRKDLYNLSWKYPFVEWGILLSKSSEGRSRFPTWHWIKEFLLEKSPGIKVSGHLCGSWVRDIIKGGKEFITENDWLNKWFDRFQLNCHAQDHISLLTSIDKYLDALAALHKDYMRREVIIQVDGVNNLLYKYAISQAAKHKGIHALAFHDLSHGAGILPAEWLRPMGDYCGYAGGLTPDNVVSQIEKIKEIIRNEDGSLYPIWIDAETGVRTNGEFDLNKVEAFLKATEPYIKY